MMKKILLVDDDAEVLSSIGTSLQARGYQVLMASNGSDAVVVTERDKPDLLILDLVLPKKNGFAVMKEIHSKVDQRIPVILITGCEDHRYESRARVLGARDFLRKPFSLQQLVSSIERFVRDHEQSEATTSEPGGSQTDAQEVIRLSCTSCQARIQAPVQLLGTTRACPRCGVELLVRPSSPIDQGPVIFFDD